MPVLVAGQRKGRGSHWLECQEEGRWKARAPHPEPLIARSAPAVFGVGFGGVLTTLGLRLAQERRENVGLASEGSGWA